jgi:hypothetical protein
VFLAFDFPGDREGAYDADHWRLSAGHVDGQDCRTMGLRRLQTRFSEWHQTTL